MTANMDWPDEGQTDAGAGAFPLLLTPGPLTTSAATKKAMTNDWGSRDVEFIALVKSIRARLLEIACAGPDRDCVLIQGSGTFAIEAALSSFVPRDGKALVVVNGAYGKRAARILDYLGRAYAVLEYGEAETPDPARLEAVLAGDPALSDVFLVHCETTSGIVNPLDALCAAVRAQNRRVIVDAMSSFGALPIDVDALGIDVLVSSANKCLEGAPGFAYVLARHDLLVRSQGRSHSLSLDLYDQWQAMERTGQFRFTPPTHILVAFDQALKEHADEGGVAGRGARYARNRDVLVGALSGLGFAPLLDDAHAGPIIQTFHAPRDPNFDFDRFYDALRERGYAIYPGKLTDAPAFRIGTIGALDETVMRGVADAIAQVLETMGVSDLAPPHR
ncbi:MAG: 2-aminoethylphosphonate--pyruvate transaminase [Hyphomicrobiales bacterium]